MRAFLENYFSRVAFRFLVAVSVTFSVQTGWGDQTSLVPLPPTNQDPDWILGPAAANLADFAKIEVLEGYRFTDARGAKILLERMRNPVPKNLVGLLAPDSGKWWVVIDYTQLGYMKGLKENFHIDGDVVLKGIRNRLLIENARRVSQGAVPITAVDWAMQPVLDTNLYTLEWALRAETQVEKVVNLQQEIETNAVVNHTMRLIGNQRVIGLTAVVQTSEMTSEAIPLKQLTENICFNPGERYADYKAGDTLAKLTLDEIIIGEKIQTNLSPYAWAGIWAGVGVVGLSMLILSAMLVRRRFRRLKRARAFPDYDDHGHALSAMFGNGKNGAHNGARRRKAFNYQKFYSDMMLEVSSGPYVLHPAANGKHQPGKIPEPAPVPVPVAESPMNQGIMRANMELIANQHLLIEEQKRLMHEQGKFIEEKSKLIHEKSRLLQQQADLLERDLI